MRGQYDGYLDIEGVVKESTTETYAAMRLEIDNWRWAGVPWFIRTGKKLPVTQTEMRAVFRDPPRLGFMEHGPPPPRAEPVRRQARPLDRHARDPRRAPRRRRGPEAVTLDVEFAEQGGEAPTPYEVLLLDAMRGDSTRFTRQDGVEETWRIFQPLSSNRHPCTPTPRAWWGPAEGDGWSRASASGAARGWHESPVDKAAERPTSPAGERPPPPTSERGRRRSDAQSAAMPSPFPPIADYAFLSDCHTGALSPRREHRLAVRAALRRSERVRHAARPPGRRLPLRAVRDQRALGAGLRAGDEHPADDVEDPDAAGRSCATR